MIITIFFPFQANNRITQLFAVHTPLYSLLVLIFIAVTTYLYVKIVFNPKYITDLMERYEYSLVKKNNEYFKLTMLKVLVVTALFLIIISLLPRLVMLVFRIPSYLIAQLIGGVAVVQLIGVFSDTLCQIDFYRSKAGSKIKEWSLCYVAFDEIEAQIKKGYLKGEGIEALVKPFRYSWGLPIRTVIDQYQIYVPSNSKEEARKLIL